MRIVAPRLTALPRRPWAGSPWLRPLRAAAALPRGPALLQACVVVSVWWLARGDAILKTRNQYFGEGGVETARCDLKMVFGESGFMAAFNR